MTAKPATRVPRARIRSDNPARACVAKHNPQSYAAANLRTGLVVP